MMRSLADYITHMARDGTYGDQITLYAAANLYNIDIQTVSSLGLVGSMCSVRQQVFQQLAYIVQQTKHSHSPAQARVKSTERHGQIASTPAGRWGQGRGDFRNRALTM